MLVLNDEQKMMIETVRRFIREACKPLEDTLENEGALPLSLIHI